MLAHGVDFLQMCLIFVFVNQMLLGASCEGPSDLDDSGGNQIHQNGRKTLCEPLPTNLEPLPTNLAEVGFTF